MKHTILVTGGNAAGKTTLVEEAVRQWSGDSRVRSILADNDSEFKGESTAQEAAVEAAWLSDTPVLIFEGTRINTPLQRVARKHPGVREYTPIVLIQKPDVMKAHMIARCAKRNKAFRADYWTYSKLEYEGVKRYVTNLRKNGVSGMKIHEVNGDYSSNQTIIELIQQKITEALCSVGE